IFNAKIPDTWYIYSNDFDPDLGPLLTELILEDSTGVEKKGTLRAIAPKEKYEEIWEGDVTYFDKEGEFRQTFSITSEEINIKGVVFYQMCSDISGQCVNYEEDFYLQVKANSPGEVVENQKPDESSVNIIEEDIVEEDSTETEQELIPQPSTSEEEVA